MKTYHNEGPFSKTIGVEVNDDDTIAVTVNVNENGSVERILPEGRKFNQFELWAIDDEIEDDAEIQDAITEREENYARSHESQRQQVSDDWESAIEGCRMV